MPAGRNQLADIAQLTDALLSGQQVIQLSNPVVGDEIYIMPSPRREFEVVSAHFLCIDGNGRCRISIADVDPPVAFDPVNTGADVNTANDMLFDEGDVLKYDANGGDTSGNGSNVALPGDAIKFILTEVNDIGTAGLLLVADIELRHLRNATP